MKPVNTAVAVLLGLAVAAPALAAGGKDPKKDKLVKRGEYLVNSMGCADCHSPKNMTPDGPQEDKTRILSGHPAEPKLPPPPALAPGPWIAVASGDLTAWSGPWGISYARNLTPDKETGLGDWTAQNFIDTIRSGKRLGKGRPLLPPMPWPAFRSLNDDDLKAMFAYLQSIPAVKNPVPEPVPPEAQPAVAAPKK
jgi:hypothetical protein